MNLVYFAAGYLLGGPSGPRGESVPMTAADWWMVGGIMLAAAIPAFFAARYVHRIMKASLQS